MRYFKIRFKVFQDPIINYFMAMCFRLYNWFVQKILYYINIQISRSLILLYEYSLDKFHCLYSSVLANEFHIDLFIKKCKVSFLWSQCVHTPPNRAIESNIISWDTWGRFSFIEEYLYNFTKVFVYSHELQLLKSLEWWGS